MTSSAGTHKQLPSLVIYSMKTKALFSIISQPKGIQHERKRQKCIVGDLTQNKVVQFTQLLLLISLIFETKAEKDITNKLITAKVPTLHMLMILMFSIGK